MGAYVAVICGGHEDLAGSSLSDPDDDAAFFFMKNYGGMRVKRSTLISRLLKCIFIEGSTLFFFFERFDCRLLTWD